MDDRSHMAPLSVHHIRSVYDTAPAPQGWESSGGKVGSEVKAPVWAPGCY